MIPLPASLFRTLEDGRACDLFALEEVDFQVKPMAKRLAQINRYGGAMCWPYSVAIHSLLVSKLCEIHSHEEAQRRNLSSFVSALAYDGLMHDTTESFGIGDLILPIKRECEAYREIEERIRLQLVSPLQLEAREDPFVRRMDERAYQLECKYMRGAWPTAAHSRFAPWPVTGEEHEACLFYCRQEFYWRDAARLFVLAFERLAPKDVKRRYL